MLVIVAVKYSILTMAPTIVLITGTTRGIGKGLLELYLKRPNHIIIVGNRDPSDPKSTILHDLPKAEGTTLDIVKIDSTSPTDAATAADALAAKFGHIDILIANSGIANLFPKFVEVTIEDIKPHIEVNYFGFIRLYQAFRLLLKKAKDPRWVTIGSSAAFLTNFGSHPNAAYGPTKAVQHWYTKAISFEDPWLNAFPVDPGWVQTDLGGPQAPLTVAFSTAKLLNVIDTSTRETHSGKMWSYDGSEVPW
ncbi:hypothetical protein BGW36DRAFT_389259 [Talaromyces proteolyticus]|uniref:NAD(P)-binding protein n=1 Tax=Talaromyces proteolyticus TaxID=1131652 RepID=A0AAD4KF16_9EURO|nr:uncharacterized protein BGW36DRAFT_389259 [Talaromyces proteolyticus]KAH8690749.1 hypothetical protein BGW36DRAFT_389259 [Talaromyces proteolyticus]